MIKKLLVASHNLNKVKEIKDVLNDVDIISLHDLNDFEDFEESGQTFEENSFLKAYHYFLKYEIPTLADDSGIEVYALNNKPGIFSKRYSGLGDALNNEKLINDLANEHNKQAQMRCVLTYMKNVEEIIQFEGIIKGEITDKPRGKNGFGYDSIFLIPTHNKTLAELDNSYKLKNSHRAQAVQLFKGYIDENISNK